MGSIFNFAFTAKDVADIEQQVKETLAGYRVDMLADMLVEYETAKEDLQVAVDRGQNNNSPVAYA